LSKDDAKYADYQDRPLYAISLGLWTHDPAAGVKLEEKAFRAPAV
jgi:hypothetical protein